ncbi:hypothetical protein CDV31_006281 [Fusarium ambrosium]|uniref:Uncharacterized protein n=1 Tax=Fusarium ambrosium TaxID=131363 RepID=A0A428UDU6_9HYPO|nr:hypothetical protein CDV31_006281 [Fusarium ambrosium]
MSLNQSHLLPPGIEIPDGRCLATRRAYMLAVFNFHGPVSDEKMAAERAYAIKMNCAFLHQKAKLTKISEVYFEYAIDNGIWHNWFVDQHNAGLPTPEWPWYDTKPDRDDMTEGTSPVYAQWLRDNVPVELEPQLASVRPSASIPPGTVSPPTTETMPVGAPAHSSSTVATDAVPPQSSASLRPQVPSLAVRRHVWNAIYGDRWPADPYCGPFEVSIPPWLDFKGLVLGHNGYLFAGVLETIHQDLAISWEMNELNSPNYFDYRSHKLVVGFSNGVDYDDIANQSHLKALWENVTSWVDTVYQGRPRTLASYLRNTPET